ncbi:hypothetical protein ONZ45_g9551 [Pleurotus djamor]|nr:hypothetical protein ONZ45_g9551 [Pleurotus djamor]
MRGRILPSFMSSRAPKVGGLREDTSAANSQAQHTQPVRRTTCDHLGEGKHRNLVINLDGTANQFSAHSTNVVELFSRLIKDEWQLVYYDSGIGTYAPPSFRSLSYIKQVIVHAIDTAIAWNFEEIVHAAYKWLSENYQPGDRIFLFGFSRGAYQARVIAGMIETVGLLHKGNERQIPFAYELYSSVMDNNKRDTSSSEVNNSAPSKAEGKIPKSEKRRREQKALCDQFKRSLCHKNVKVHFVGAWDTVSSIGVLRGESFPETVSGMGHVCHFRHALALDERRVKFQPEFANGGLGPQMGDIGDVREVWFAGSHSDIGGGNIKNEKLRNFGPALRWMTYEAMALGLRIEPFDGSWTALPLTKSLTTIWRIFEVVPFPSLTYKDANSTSARPHLCASRKIQQGQLIHQSVFARRTIATDSDSDSRSSETSAPRQILPRFVKPRSKSYLPKAALPTTIPDSWEDFLSKELDAVSIVEKDPFENASHALSLLADVSADPGMKWGVLPVIMTTLRPFADDDTRLASLVEVPDAGAILKKFIHSAVLDLKMEVPLDTKEILPSKVYEWGSEIAKSRQMSLLKVAQLFACLGNLQADRYINGITFLLVDPEQIVFTTSPAATTSVLIWDGSTRLPKDAAREVPGGYSTISCDGSHIAVGDGKDVGIIKTTAEPPSTTKYTDDEDPNDSGDIRSQSFSTDNQSLATGHGNGWIKRWRREGDQWKVVKRFKGRDYGIYRLAFSRDGSRLAFDAGPVKIWDSADDAVIELEHSGDWSSFAWSPLGDQIVSGTVDGSMKIWSTDRGEIRHTFKAHACWIRCLAFRDDGQVLATGSEDHRIRIWQCSTWEKSWEFDIGEWVMALAFSPDGKRLVSGGEDGALHLWDVDMGDNKPVD